MWENVWEGPTLGVDVNVSSWGRAVPENLNVVFQIRCFHGFAKCAIPTNNTPQFKFGYYLLSLRLKYMPHFSLLVQLSTRPLVRKP